ncbi:MAG: hypothetical protein ACTIIB_04430 [Ancrocorticia populi]
MAQDSLNQGNDFQQDFAECMEGDGDYEASAEASFLEENLGGLGQSIASGEKRLGCFDTAFTENPGDAIAAGAGNAASAFWGDPIGDLTKAVMEGNSEALQVVMTFWMDFRLDGGIVDSQVQGVKNITWGLGAVFLVISLMIGGGRIAAARRQGLTDETLDSGSVIVRYLIFSLAVPAAIPGALVASDLLSEWIMTSFGASDEAEVFQSATLEESMAGPVVMIALALFALCGSVMQIIALMVRVLLLPIIAGLAPLFAAASFSETGRGAVKSMAAWLIAAIAFKPAASLLYVVAFWTVSGVQNGAVSGVEQGSVYSAILCSILLALAGFTAPALLRVIAPMVAAAGGGGGAPVMATGAALGGAALGMAGGALGALGRAAGGAAKSSTGSGAASGPGAGSGSGSAGSGSSPTSGGGGGPRPSGDGGGQPAGSGGGGGGGPRSGGGGHAGGGSASPRPAGAAAGRKGASASTPRSMTRAGSVQSRAAMAGLAGSVEQSVSQTPTTTSTPILDENIGATGSYQGQVRR